MGNFATHPILTNMFLKYGMIDQEKKNAQILFLLFTTVRMVDARTTMHARSCRCTELEQRCGRCVAIACPRGCKKRAPCMMPLIRLGFKV